MKIINKLFVFILPVLFFSSSFCFCSSHDDKGNSSEDVDRPATDNNGGYLFAHMTPADYGKLFYSVSRDGLKWETLNNRNVILDDYRGHPDICQGGDNNFYMIGIQGDNAPYLTLYSTPDLVTWRRKDLDRSVFDVSHLGLQNEGSSVGAPKMFYDEDSKQYIITWHAFSPGLSGNALWESMRTCYILTSDFETFTPAQRLFNFTGDDEDMATIDTIIKKEGDTYYAIIKDERWPEKCATGKTIRIATSANLTGPYSNPGPPITPAWREAPTLVKSMDDKNWFLYVEDYRNSQYNLFKASSLTGSMWSQVEFTPPVARHGCIIRVSEKLYEGIVKAYTVK